jgi:methylenetetrahydrofolate dehydrogenase (NADP+)/methenyltetrahydrofolate cyclohydrolase
MAAKIIDGKQTAADMRAELKEEVAKLKQEGIVPGLGVILVGEDPASQSYVTAKERTCEDLGIYSDDNRLPEDTTQQDLIALVNRMNADPKINGILVQLPLPKHLDEAEVLLTIDPNKDVDGFHPTNIGKMVAGQKAFLPCTPHGVIQLLVRSGVTIDSPRRYTTAGSQRRYNRRLRRGNRGTKQHRRQTTRQYALSESPEPQRHRNRLPHSYQKPRRSDPQG